ncbi:MAG: HAMP domain-containing sensor histidine kinase [Bacillota bacterium]
MNSIRTHLTLSHLVLALIVLVLMGILLNSMVRSYLLNEARRTLNSQGRSIAQLFAMEIILRGQRPFLVIDERLRVWSRAVTAMINTDFVVLSAAGELLVPSDAIELPEDPQQRVSMEPVDRALQSGEIQSTEWKTPDGDPLVAVFVPIQLHPDTPPVGIVIQFQKVTAATRAAADLRQIMMQTGGVALILALALSLIFARRISRPAEELSEVARALGRGELQRRAPEGYVREFSQLATQINEMARDLSQLLARRQAFTATISHEIRTPVTSIRGFIQAINDGVISEEEQGPYLETILKETHRIERLLDDLLQLERLEAGQMSMQLDWISCRELLNRAVARAAPRAAQSNIEVHLVDPGPLEIWGDEERLDQVLGNLMDNALSFAEPGGSIEIGGGLESEKDATAGATFWVADDGPGIAEEDLPHIFDRFYQAPTARREGVGLGLAISREIVNLHGGRISGQNRPGGGAVFRFTIPGSRRRDEASP